MARRLLLLRHGRIAANVEGRWHGSTNSPLLPAGQRQAKRVARRLEQREPPLTTIYSSPLERCQDTAEIVLAALERHRRRLERRAERRRFRHRWLARLSLGLLGDAAASETLQQSATKPLELRTHEDLREYSIGEWEDLSFAELAREHQFLERSRRDPAFAPPGGESLKEVAARVSAALVEIDAAHGAEEDVLVVSHGALMGIAIAALINGKPEQWPDYHLDNCSLSEISLDGVLPELHSFNHTAHL